MFTGIVQEVGRAKENGGSSLTIEAAASLDGLKLGDSIAVNWDVSHGDNPGGGELLGGHHARDPETHQPGASDTRRAGES